MLELFIYVFRRPIHLEVVKLIVHHRDVAAAVPERCLMLILHIDGEHVDSVTLPVVEKFLIASNSNRSQLIIVPLLGDFLDSLAAEKAHVLGSTPPADEGAVPDEEVRRFPLRGEAYLSEAVDTMLIIGRGQLTVKVLPELWRLVVSRRQ